MGDRKTSLAGIQIPSTDPTFLFVVGLHILLGLACTVAGAVAMLSQKRAGRHPRYGTIYFWCLTGVFLTATALAAVRWTENYHLFILGLLSFAAACLGRQARRQRWPNWVRLHIAGMGVSYILLLTAFYVDNGHQLPNLERPTPPNLLAVAGGCWDTAHRSRTSVAPVSATAKLVSFKLTRCLAMSHKAFDRYWMQRALFGVHLSTPPAVLNARSAASADRQRPAETNRTAGPIRSSRRPNKNGAIA